MKLNYDEMKQINETQLEIFKKFVEVCSYLNLKYFMIHGSLLGTLRYNGFFPFDDDIDVAMPRKDYDIFISNGQKLMPDNLFIQSCFTEKEFPLPFAKIRDSNTAFIQPILKNCNVNKGIYIDVFPIDLYPENKIRQIKLYLLDRIYTIRINANLHNIKDVSFYKTIIFKFAKLVFPSWRKAVEKRANLYCKDKKSNKIVITGGKLVDRGIPAEWLQNHRVEKFEKIDVSCPIKTEEYLKCIYGDYLNYNPSEKYMIGECVNVSAEKVSTTMSYKELL